MEQFPRPFYCVYRVPEVVEMRAQPQPLGEALLQSNNSPSLKFRRGTVELEISGTDPALQSVLEKFFAASK